MESQIYKKQRPAFYNCGWSYKSKCKIFGIPLVHIALGTNGEGKLLVAKGIIAIGQFAIGLITISQFGIGLLSIGHFVFAGVGISQFGIGGIMIAQFSISIASLSQFSLSWFHFNDVYIYLKNILSLK